MAMRGIERRNFLIVSAALALPGGAAFGETNFGRPLSLKSAATEAWLYGLPLIEMANARARPLRGADKTKPLPANQFRHTRLLAGPSDRAVTSPNNDTLFSSAWVDLTQGSVTITLPPTGERYFSLQLMDFYTNTFAVLGSRTTGGAGGVVTLFGPTVAASIGAIRSPTPWVWALGRMLVDGPSDLGAAHALQDRLTLVAQAPSRTPRAYASRTAPWDAYFGSAQALLVENPPQTTDAAFFSRISALGLRPDGGFDPGHFTAAQAAEITEGVAEARASVGRGIPGRITDGWLYPDAKFGDFGQDYAYRASVALTGLAGLIPAEAVYLRPVNVDGGDEFDGDGVWRIHLPNGGPPVDAFWSLTLYEHTPDHQRFLTPNPLNRYSIGDRTPGLTKNADMSLDIWISRADPGGGRTANWLPAPKNGPFGVALRCYLPKAQLIDGNYRLPPMQKI